MMSPVSSSVYFHSLSMFSEAIQALGLPSITVPAGEGLYLSRGCVLDVVDLGGALVADCTDEGAEEIVHVEDAEFEASFHQRDQ